MTTEAQPLSAECCLFDAQVEETVRERQRKLAAFEIATMNIVDTEVVALIRIIDACRAENDRLTRQLKLATEILTNAGPCNRNCENGQCEAQDAIRDTLAAVKEAGNGD